jgi:hypothetical protein
MINQEAQDHATACALCAGLLGQRAPACKRRPGRHTPRDQPTPRVALDPIERAPSPGRGPQRALGLFLWERPDAPLGVVGADVQPRPATKRSHCCTAPEAPGRRGPGRRGTISRPGLGALRPADVLRAASRREPRHALAQRGGARPKGRRALERIGRAPVPRAGGRCRCAWGEQAPRAFWCGRIGRVRRRWRWPRRWGALVLLASLRRLIPGAQRGSGRREGKADRAGEGRRAPQEAAQAWPPDIATPPLSRGVGPAGRVLWLTWSAGGR